MADFKGGVVGVLLAIFGIVLTIVGWFWIPAIADALSIGLLKAIFYIGLLVCWILSFVVIPANLIMGGNGNVIDVAKGLGFFLAGTLCSAIAYWIIPPIVEVMNGIFSSDMLTGISWFILIMFWVLVMIVIPAYLITRSTYSKSGGQNE